VSPRSGSGPPYRRVSGEATRKQLLVFVEGLKTEERYLIHWYRSNRDRVLVRIDLFRGTPLQLVQHAVDAQRQERRDERRGRGRAYDEIWCMFDVDVHPNIPDARDLARRHDIHLAVSNPCLELWFILHFEDRTAWIDRREAQRRSEELLGCSKILTDNALSELFERYGEAATRAEQLDRKHQGDGSPPGENPSSSVRHLVYSIAP